MTLGPGARGAGPVLLLVAALAAIVYLPSLGGAFVSDDAVLVAANPAVRSWSAALASFGRSYWYGLKGVEPYYRPLPILTYALDHSVAGLRPLAYHVTNVALHAGCAVLVALLVLALRLESAADSQGAGTDRRGAWLAGAAFAGSLAAAHPLHSEPVAAIYGRPDLLAALFVLATLNLAVRGRPVWALASLGLALLSKESAAGIPFLAPIVMAAGARAREPGRSLPARRVLLAAASMAVLGGYLALRAHAIGLHVDPRAYTVLDNPLVRSAARERWMTPVAIVGRYASLWFWPARLCADRGFDTVPAVSSAGDPFFLLGALILIAGALSVIALARARSIWAAPLAASGLAFLPASNLLLLAPAQMAERFVYLPSMLICVLLGGALARWGGAAPLEGGIRPRGRPLQAWGTRLAAVLVVLLLAGRTYVRAGDFRDDLSLYGSTAAACPLSVKARYNLGNALAGAGRDAEAIDAFKAAVSIAPWMAIAHNNMGNSYLHLRRLREAEASFRDAVKQSPGLLNPHESLAGILYLDGRLAEALEEARIALSLNPDPGDAAQLQDLVGSIERRLATGS